MLYLHFQIKRKERFEANIKGRSTLVLVTLDTTLFSVKVYGQRDMATQTEVRFKHFEHS
jgi:hypothetical protein